MTIRATTDLTINNILTPVADLSGAYLAGGAVLDLLSGREPNDYDIYPKSKDDAKAIVTELWSGGSAEYSSHSEKAVTFLSYEKNSAGRRVPIQVILFDTFESPEKVFSTFDFSVCMVAADLDSGVTYHDERFFQSALSKEIVFNKNAKHPLSSLLRVNKYEKKGYKFSKSVVAQMAFAVANSNLPTSWEEAASLIGGYYGRQLKLDGKDLTFSYDNLFEVLGNLDLDDGFNYDIATGNVDLGVVLDIIEPIKRDHVRLSGARIVEVRDGLLGKIVGSGNKGTDFSDHLIKSYKYVVLKDGQLQSQYSSKFKYELGKVASAPHSPWLYSSKVNDSYKKANGVLIECYTLPEYVRDYQYNSYGAVFSGKPQGCGDAILQSQHLYVSRVVPEDEVRLLKNKELVAVVAPNDPALYGIRAALKAVAPAVAPSVPGYDTFSLLEEYQKMAKLIQPVIPAPKYVGGDWTV